ncbi:hypothetical protein MKEN_01405700 [Mycena kentingensis (nom. inval.)]|nr:hypothetical protein MKEN_01405700 [Mycena kentingensis (nom. inval.)]
MDVDEYPSLLWVAIPSVLLVSGWLARRWYLARKLRVHGIGKGAPGFQTSVKKVRVPPEIMERIRRGEDVSAEEVTAAMARMEAEERGEATPSPSKRRKAAKPTPAEPPADPANEWLPESVTSTKKRAKGKRK